MILSLASSGPNEDVQYAMRFFSYHKVLACLKISVSFIDFLDLFELQSVYSNAFISWKYSENPDYEKKTPHSRKLEMN